MTVASYMGSPRVDVLPTGQSTITREDFFSPPTPHRLSSAESNIEASMTSCDSLVEQDPPEPRSTGAIGEEGCNTTYFSGATNCHVGTLNIKPTVNTGHPGSSLSALNPILDASHKRNRRTSPPNSQCLPGTRGDVIQEIVSWAIRSLLFDSQHILWIFGYVGCGKSAIAQTVAKALEAAGRLGASFFFFRGAGDRSRVRRLAHTIAIQIAVSIPGTAQHIQVALDAIPGLLEPTTPLALQFQHLVYDPIRAVVGKLFGVWSPFVILIDGFDECEDREEVAQMIEDLVELFEQRPYMPLRFIITSRVEGHLHEKLHKSKQVRLFNLVNRTSDMDISTALDVSISNAQGSRVLAASQGWLTLEDKRILIKHIGGSFIFLTTITNFLFAPFERDHLTPRERLPLALNMNPGFDGLYKTILESGQRAPHFSDIIGVIALAHEALSAVEIADLLEIQVIAVVSLLVKLHAIIHLPDDDAAPITLWHTSLRDFLNDKSRSGPLCATGYAVRFAGICIDLTTPPISTQDRPGSLYAQRYVWAHYRAATRAMKDVGREDIHNAILDQVQRPETFLNSAPDEIVHEIYQSILANPNLSHQAVDLLKTLALLMAPLSITQICDLCEYRPIDVSDAIESLNVGAILPSPQNFDLLLVIPSSFRAFLSDERLAGAFFASPQGHQYLTSRCISLTLPMSVADECLGSDYAKQHVWAHYQAALGATAGMRRRKIHQSIFTQVERKEPFLNAAPDGITVELCELIVEESCQWNRDALVRRLIEAIARAESPLPLDEIINNCGIGAQEAVHALAAPGLQNVVDFPANSSDSERPNSSRVLTLRHQSFRNFLANPGRLKKLEFAGDATRDVLILVVGDRESGRSHFINKLLSAMGSTNRIYKGRGAPSRYKSDAGIQLGPVVVTERDWVGNYPHIKTDAKDIRLIILAMWAKPNEDMSSSHLSHWIHSCYPKASSELDRAPLIGGVVYLHDATRNNFIRSKSQLNVAVRNIRSLRSRFKFTWSSVVPVTTTKRGEGPERRASFENRKKELAADWAELTQLVHEEEGAKVMGFGNGSVETEEENALEVVHPILKRIDILVGDRALKGLDQAQTSLKGLQVETTLGQDLRRALDQSVILHSRTLALDLDQVSQEDVDVAVRELEKSKEEIDELGGCLSRWDRIRIFGFNQQQPLSDKY